MTRIDKLWIPEGIHWDLKFEHRPLEDAGPFTGGGWKQTWHTTESPREAVDPMFNVLKATPGIARGKRAAPHFVIGYRSGYHLPVVIQMIALNRAGRSLAHDRGPETNRANTIQIEVCGYTATCHQWEDNWLKALANLTCWISHRVPISMHNPRTFQNPVRYTPNGWIVAKGHNGHVHAPSEAGNTHTDPKGMRCSRMLHFAREGQQDIKPH